jgi:hypothetical protein
MKRSIAKRVAPAILALCIAGGSIGAAAGPAFASSKSKSHSTAVKVGAACNKSEAGKTVKVKNETLVCKETNKSKKQYQWEKS